MGRGLPSTRIFADGPTTSAGLVSVLPSTTTRPSAIQASASRREQSPARAILFAMRSPSGLAPSGLAPAAGAPFSARCCDEGIEDSLVADTDGIFGMPLDAEAIAVAGILDALDHAIGGNRIDDHAGADRLHRLMMGAVDRQLVGPADAMEQGVLFHPHGVAGLGAHIGLLMGDSALDLVGDVLDQGAAQNHVQKL